MHKLMVSNSASCTRQRVNVWGWNDNSYVHNHDEGSSYLHSSFRPEHLCTRLGLLGGTHVALRFLVCQSILPRELSSLFRL